MQMRDIQCDWMDVRSVALWGCNNANRRERDIAHIPECPPTDAQHANAGLVVVQWQSDARRKFRRTRRKRINHARGTDKTMAPTTSTVRMCVCARARVRRRQRPPKIADDPLRSAPVVCGGVRPCAHVPIVSLRLRHSRRWLESEMEESLHLHCSTRRCQQHRRLYM